jgi:hypothetical protein
MEATNGRPLGIASSSRSAKMHVSGYVSIEGLKWWQTGVHRRPSDQRFSTTPQYGVLRSITTCKTGLGKPLRVR